MGCMEQEVRDCKFKIERLLIARRVVIGALLVTATWDGSRPKKWNVSRFSQMMPNWEWRLKVKAKLEYISNVVNFDHIWLKHRGDVLHKLLLPEEYRWLKQTFPAAEYPQINSYIDQAYPAESR